MINKIKNAVVDMNSKVVFIKKPRHYETLDGKWLQGVSTVSSIIPKEWLSAWGAKEAVKFLGYSDYAGDTAKASEMMARIKDLATPEAFIELLKEAKGASGRKSKTALVDGKAGHAWLEEYVKAEINKSKPPLIPEGALSRPINQFLDWAGENIKEWILSEALVAYPEKGYAGTLDGMAIMATGKLALIDFKFASHLSEDYWLQTAGYSACFEPYGIKVDDRVIIRLPKTLEREEFDDKKWVYYMVPNNIEVEIVKTNYELDRDTFFHCLPVKQWINAVTKDK